MPSSEGRREAIKQEIAESIVAQLEIPHSPSIDRVAKLLILGLLNSPAIEIDWKEELTEEPDQASQSSFEPTAFSELAC